MITKKIFLALMIAGTTAVLGAVASEQPEFCGACKEEEPLLPEVVWPWIDFWADPTQVLPGEFVVLRWSVEGAEEVALWAEPGAPVPAEAVDWEAISEFGERVELAVEIPLPVEETTTFYLVAKAPLGMAGTAVVVEVLEEVEPLEPEEWTSQRHSPKAWITPPAIPASSAMLSQVKPASAAASYSGLASPAPPRISISVSPRVIFTNGSATLSWNITNAKEFGYCESRHVTFMAPASTFSGTRITGGAVGSGCTPPLQRGFSGTYTIRPPSQAGHRRESFYATNASGQSSTAEEWVDILSIPRFQGCNASRERDIRHALLDIDQHLRTGCIYNDTGLDKTVAAFKKGQLSREGVWWNLLAQLQNLHLVTFKCNNVTDRQWVAGRWWDFSNTINLNWSPSHTPRLEYVILHELIHKVGFHSGLYRYGYSKAQIENQAHAVTSACYP